MGQAKRSAKAHKQPEQKDTWREWSIFSVRTAIKAKVIRNFFLDAFLSAKSPRIGANKIRNRLADEFAIPSVNVRSASDKDDANSSAYIIG